MKYIRHGALDTKDNSLHHIYESELQVKMCFPFDMEKSGYKLVKLEVEIIGDLKCPRLMCLKKD